MRFQKHNIVVRFASGNERPETIRVISQRIGRITFNIVVGKLATFMSKFLKDTLKRLSKQKRCGLCRMESGEG